MQPAPSGLAGRRSGEPGKLWATSRTRVPSLKRAKERGDPHGRPAVMTAERIEVATRMLAERRHIEREILPALKLLDGPAITRSPLYAWTKHQKRLMVPAHSMEDR